MANDPDKFELTYKHKQCHFLHLEWTINNFSTISSEIKSSVFPASDCKIKWRIIANFYNHYDRYNGSSRKMSVGLERADTKISGVKGWLHFEIQNSNKIAYFKKTLHLSENKMKKSSSNFESPIANKDQRSLESSSGNLYFYNKIVIVCKLSVMECNDGNNKFSSLQTDNVSQLQQDFKALLQDQELTDIQLKSQQNVIQAHKFVLCARSNELKKIMEKEVQRNKGRKRKIQLTLKQMRKPVLDAFLLFVYTGKIEDRKFDTVTDLYSIADNYKVLILKELCRDILVSYISVTTVPRVLKLSDKHKDNVLKETSVDFICTNFPEIEITEEWGSLLDYYPRLASYTLRRVSSSISKR